MRVYDIEDLPQVEKIGPWLGRKHSNKTFNENKKCNGKRMYHSKKIAQVTLERQIREGKAEKLRIYRCPYGTHFHLTNTKKKRIQIGTIKMRVPINSLTLHK